MATQPEQTSTSLRRCSVQPGPALQLHLRLCRSFCMQSKISKVFRHAFIQSICRWDRPLHSPFPCADCRLVPEWYPTRARSRHLSVTNFVRHPAPFSISRIGLYSWRINLFHHWYILGDDGCTYASGRSGLCIPCSGVGCDDGLRGGGGL